MTESIILARNNEADRSAIEAFKSVKENILELAKNVSEMNITTDADLKIATNHGKDLNSVLKKVDAVRKYLKEPSMEEGKIIDARAKELTIPASEAIITIKQKILEYTDKQAQKHAQEQAKLLNDGDVTDKGELAIKAILAPFETANIRKSWTFELDE